MFAHFGILLLSRYFFIVSAFPALHRLHLHPYWYPVYGLWSGKLHFTFSVTLMPRDALSFVR